MPKVEETVTYSLAELKDKDSRAYETAGNKLAQFASEMFDVDFVIDDAKTIGRLFDLDISNIYYSGFSSQGDGACLEGTYSYRRNALREVTTYAPQDTELHRIVRSLQDVQRRNFYRLTANLRHCNAHYYHEMTVAIDVDDASEWDTEVLKNALRDYMRWIYRRLESEYEYATSEEAITEMAEANDYRFREDGTIFH